MSNYFCELNARCRFFLSFLLHNIHCKQTQLAACLNVSSIAIISVCMFVNYYVQQEEDCYDLLRVYIEFFILFYFYFIFLFFWCAGEERSGRGVCLVLAGVRSVDYNDV